ncbi:MAG: FtsX-like permease family protein [Thermoanaerobaculia bacterium]|nr:FtsX-like permease family protein [Thermoanaerobaculia bacterium]
MASGFGLALRNLARNRRRTAISLSIVAAGTVGLLLTAGFIQFSFAGLEDALIHGGLGHLEVVAKAAADERSATLERSLAHGLVDWPAIQADIESLPGVAAAAPNVHLMGMASKPDGATVSFIGLGVDPERERRMGFTTKLRAGADLAAGEPAPGQDQVLVALGLAESLGVAPGDVVTLLAMTSDQTLNALDVRVAGLVTTGIQDLDTRYLKLHFRSAQRLLATERVNDLIVGLDDNDDLATAQAALEARFASREDAPLAVVPWRDRAPFYDQVRNLYRGIFWFLGSVIFVLVVLATSNTLVMTVMERVREIGTLRAIGTSRGQVARMIVAEALWLGVLGALVGNLLGLGLIVLINGLGLQMPPPPGAVNPIDLKLAVVPAALVGSVVLMTAVLALASVFPVLKAVRLKVVEALTHV